MEEMRPALHLHQHFLSLMTVMSLVDLDLHQILDLLDRQVRLDFHQDASSSFHRLVTERG